MEPSTPLSRAHSRLHASAAASGPLPCREDEYAEIIAHIEGSILDEMGCCLYISGVPGTGKTATVKRVIKELERRRDLDEADPEKLPNFRFVEINGMRCSEPSAAYSALWEGMSGIKLAARHAQARLEARFSLTRRKPVKEEEICVVLVDELDLLVTRNQRILYHFFEWPNRERSRLVVLAVANTMDLPERVMESKVSSRLGMTRINFQPYSHTQLHQIISSRLSDVTGFDTEAVELCARKVGAVSGDARRALDICRMAVELAEMEVKERGGRLEDARVTIGLIHKAIRDMFATPAVACVRDAALQEKMFLTAFLKSLRRTGTGESTLGEVSNSMNF
ncbi:MAG: P-loop containing nucleoside triphosphate hydrolase protein [Piptocephalis tieghemiana]|nr:MAG: P-loop containing nucleoside triphosphate hydrolase protein [Piptocephalis tieghemiana]